LHYVTSINMQAYFVYF